MIQNLTAAERVAIARNNKRPNIDDYINAIFPHFFEMRGDRLCKEDSAILGGVAMFHGQSVTVIGTRKAKTLQEDARRVFLEDGHTEYQFTEWFIKGNIKHWEME